jgi:two-component system KDP operon response regulator KdpE
LPQILVIDGDPGLLSVCSVGLQALGHTVHTAETGEEGLSQAALRAPDVIVLDLGLPDLDGLVVCKRIRTWSEVTIIVLSADGSENRKVDALDYGADDYMPKPFGLRELHARYRSRCATTGPRAARNTRRSLTSGPCISTSCTARPPSTADRSTSRPGNSISSPSWPATQERSAPAG